MAYYSCARYAGFHGILMQFAGKIGRKVAGVGKIS